MDIYFDYLPDELIIEILSNVSDYNTFINLYNTKIINIINKEDLFEKLFYMTFGNDYLILNINFKSSIKNEASIRYYVASFFRAKKIYRMSLSKFIQNDKFKFMIGYTVSYNDVNNLLSVFNIININYDKLYSRYSIGKFGRMNVDLVINSEGYEMKLSDENDVIILTTIVSKNDFKLLLFYINYINSN